MLDLDQALSRLHALDPQLSTLVEMRFFAGLELNEISDVTGRSERSLKRDWRKARAFLHATLDGGFLPDD
ncbi:ECF sigma factor [compost metagenome]